MLFDGLIQRVERPQKHSRLSAPLPVCINRRVRHCQHRKVFQETVALGGTTAMAFGGNFGANLNATGGGGGGGAGWLGGTEMLR